MPKCKNDPKSFYTGKEPSPRGKGFCAKKERIGSKKRGKDGNVWVVKKRVDGVKLWTRFSSKKVIKLSKKKTTVKKKKYKMKGGVTRELDKNGKLYYYKSVGEEYVLWEERYWKNSTMRYRDVSRDGDRSLITQVIKEIKSGEFQQGIEFKTSKDFAGNNLPQGETILWEDNGKLYIRNNLGKAQILYAGPAGDSTVFNSHRRVMPGG